MSTVDDQVEQALEAGGRPTPGERLRAAREARGLGLEDVALRLNVSAAYIQALETSQFDKLPGVAFIRGYIRAYARFVELSGDELVKEYNRLINAGSEPPPVSSISKVGQQAKLSDTPVRLSVLVFVVAVLGISLWWWQSQTAAPVVPVAETPAPAGGAESAAEKTNPLDLQSRLQGRSEAQPEEPAAPTAGAEAEAEPQYLSPEQVEQLARDLENQPGDEAQAEETPAAPGAAEQPVATGTTLLMTFTDECWISIRDRDDNLVYASAKQAGETLEVQLDTPAKLLVGRVTAVSRAEFGGRPLDLQAVARKDVARLTLE